MSIAGPDRISWPTAFLLLGGILLAGVAAIELAPQESPAASWWPAAGLAVVLLGLTPRSWWWTLVPGILAASLVANVVGDRPFDLSCCYAIANAAEAVVVASFLRRGGRTTLPELATVEALLRLLAAALLGGLTIATIAAAAADGLTDGSFQLTWRAVFASHTASVLVILPLVMAPAARWTRRLAWELPLQLGALAAVTVLVFSRDQTLSLDFMPLPLLIWAALRFDVRLVAWEMFGFAVAVTGLSSRGYGTFAADNRRGELSAFGMGAIVQAYVVVAVLMTLPLAIGVAQRRSSDQLAERCDGLTGEDAFARLVAGIDGGETAARDWTWIGADGRRHTVATTLSVAADRVAARVGYLCVGRDVTEARASQEMLIAALEKERLAVQRMRELDTAKSDFVSTVSHELRTPVTSIVGYTEMLEDGTLVEPTEEQRPLLESIARNGRRLIMLCDDLLTLSGLDSGATRWERGAVDLASILVGAEDAVRAQLVGRGLSLRIVAADEPVPVLGDAVQLERALTNLLSNAVKFTEPGGRITVTVEAVGGEACLTVCDTGIGIPLEEQERLFQRFFRSSTAQERAIQGTGLGLSIVNAIVSSHGGRIDVRSAHLEGTTITIRLPLAP